MSAISRGALGLAAPLPTAPRTGNRAGASVVPQAEDETPDQWPTVTVYVLELSVQALPVLWTRGDPSD